jgi:hypothetical protein
MTPFARMKLALTGLAIAAGLCAPAHARQTTSPTTTTLTNTARLSFTSATGASSGVTSNTTTLTVTASTRPKIRLMRLAIGAEGATMDVSTTQCLVDGKGYGPPNLNGGN